MSKVDEPTGPELPSEELTEVAARKAELAVPAELVAGSATEYLRASIARIKAGDAGILPVVGGLIVVSILFQSLNSHFLTAQNLVNLLIQAAVFALLGMGEVFVLLLGEIDLSVGYVAGMGAVIMADAAGPAHGWPWWAAIGLALLACAAIGCIQGLIITRIGLPSFVVTLAGLLFWEGVMLKILGNGGTIAINDTVINDIASNNLSNAASWVVMLVIVGAVQPPGLAARRQAARGGARRAAAHDHAAQDRRRARERRRPRPPVHRRTAGSSSRSRACRGSCCSCWPSSVPGASSWAAHR